eukprot:9089378-Prorocentrum_lima.AAC.1
MKSGGTCGGGLQPADMCMCALEGLGMWWWGSEWCGSQLRQHAGVHVDGGCRLRAGVQGEQCAAVQGLPDS